jgi:hypothetical protein
LLLTNLKPGRKGRGSRELSKKLPRATPGTTAT